MDTLISIEVVGAESSRAASAMASAFGWFSGERRAAASTQSELMGCARPSGSPWS
jgi:hypothetical protein